MHHGVSGVVSGVAEPAAPSERGSRAPGGPNGPGKRLAVRADPRRGSRLLAQFGVRLGLPGEDPADLGAPGQGLGVHRREPEQDPGIVGHGQPARDPLQDVEAGDLPVPVDDLVQPSLADAGRGGAPGLAHPGVLVGAGRGWWQAVIPQANGEQVIARHTLSQLLDKLDELTGEREP